MLWAAILCIVLAVVAGLIGLLTGAIQTAVTAQTIFGILLLAGLLLLATKILITSRRAQGQEG